MGAELAVSTEILVRQPPGTDGPGAGIVYRAISAHLIQKAGFTRKSTQTGAVTLIQRFGSALYLNVHSHMLFLDGVYTTTPWGKSRLHRTNAPTQQELIELLHTISHWVARFLDREGILERDDENSYLNLEGDEDPMQQVLGSSVSYRVAIGPQQGRNKFWDTQCAEINRQKIGGESPLLGKD